MTSLPPEDLGREPDLLLPRGRGRHLLFAALYLSEGAPVGYIWWALPTMLRSEGVPVGDITALTSLLVLPWILKAFWAPLVDLLRGPRWTLRAWILSTQTLMGLSLLPVAFLDPAADFGTIRWLLLAHAASASLQDASIDALAIASVPAGRRGALNGWMQTGYLAGRAAFGGGLLLLSSAVGAAAVILPLVGLIWGTGIVLLLLTKVSPAAPDPLTSSVASRAREYLARARTMLRGRRFRLGLLFAAVSGAAFEGAGALGGPWLIDMGFSRDEAGWFFSIPAVGAMLAGAVAGGRSVDRIGAGRSVRVGLVSVALTVLLLGVVSLPSGGPGKEVASASFTLLYLAIGFFTASSYALFMDLTDPRLGGTQFSAYMGATNACESWSGLAAGAMVERAGYGAAFPALAAVSLLTLPLAGLLGRLARGTEEGRRLEGNGG